ncbi:MAG: hypothetical protein EBR02_05205 [Alphaproteobacteria bacterium]|nr:hypothetical protein [Alphaproteobacteria bacterium]
MSISHVIKSVFAISALILAVCVSMHLSAEKKFRAYDIQERCGQLSAMFWEKKSGKNSYQNHYDTKSNRCVVLEKEVSFKPNGKSVVIKKLYDVNENKLLADLHVDNEKGAPDTCEVLGEKCGSQDEWVGLTKSFIREKE